MDHKSPATHSLKVALFWTSTKKTGNRSQNRSSHKTDWNVFQNQKLIWNYNVPCLLCKPYARNVSESTIQHKKGQYSLEEEYPHEVTEMVANYCNQRHRSNGMFRIKTTLMEIEKKNYKKCYLKVKAHKETWIIRKHQMALKKFLSLQNRTLSKRMALPQITQQRSVR